MWWEHHMPYHQKQPLSKLWMMGNKRCLWFPESSSFSEHKVSVAGMYKDLVHYQTLLLAYVKCKLLVAGQTCSWIFCMFVFLDLQKSSSAFGPGFNPFTINSAESALKTLWIMCVQLMTMVSIAYIMALLRLSCLICKWEIDLCFRLNEDNWCFLILLLCAWKWINQITRQ